jgi:hypothetical protein
VYIKVGNKVEPAAYVRNITATFDFEKEDIRTLGFRGAQHKITGWSGSGSMNIFAITSVFAEMAQQYHKTGVSTYFTLVITGYDPTSTVGRQVTNLRNVLIDSVDIAKLDVENTALDMDVDFTFDDFELQESFRPAQRKE